MPPTGTPLTRAPLPAALVVAVLGLALLGRLLAAAPAQAHVPLLEPAEHRGADGAEEGSAFPGAVQVPTPEVSRAVYGTLAPDEQFDAYRFTVDEGVTIPVHILVPADGELSDFRPSFALVGPGIESRGSPPAFIAQALSADASGGGISADTPVMVVTHEPGERSTFFEPFSLERYWEGPEVKAELVPGQSYFLLVWDEGVRSQALPYVLGLGDVERFGFSEALHSVTAVFRLKLGLYGQEEFQWGWFFILLLILVFLLGGAFFLGRRMLSR